MENKLESRTDILDRLAIKFGKKDNIEGFRDFIETYNYDAVIVIVRQAMAEYENQGNKSMYSKSQVIKLIKKSIGDFLSEGCPNYPKDKRGSWINWTEEWTEKNV